MTDCICFESDPRERNGHSSSCNRHQRKQEERARRVKTVAKEIKKFSPKMDAALVEYSKLKKAFLKANPKCTVYPELDAIEPHHMAGKATIELLLNTDYWLPVSRQGHTEIEMNPEWAKSKGFSLSRLATEPKKI